MKGVIRKSLGVCAGLLLLAPASALAGEASVVNGIPRYDASFGETNDVTVGELPGPGSLKKTIVYRDVVEIEEGANCFEETPFETHCVVTLNTTLARAGLGNRGDRIGPSAVHAPTTVGISSEGDLGDDTMFGTPQRDVLDGNGGNDVIHGNGGNDTIEGGPGDDLLDCGAGVDLALFTQGDTVFNNCEQIQLQ